MDRPDAASPNPIRDPTVPLRRLPAIVVDVTLWCVLAFLWAWQVESLHTPIAEVAISTGSGSALMLADRFPALLAVAMVMLMIALHTPFSWRGQTLGLGSTGLQLRYRGQPAIIAHVASWALLTWGLGIVAAAGLFAILMGLTGDDADLVLAPIGGLGLVPLLANELLGLVTGATPVDRLLSLDVVPRDTPLPEPEPLEEDHTSGWSPRARSFAWQKNRPVDAEVHLWRSESSINPFSGLVGGAETGSIPEPPPEPDHVEHSATPMPGMRGPDPQEEALIARLRERLKEPE